ncbi:MAG: DegT/DnrJ/EryC1/StrS family aminotransferase, partial [Planctomycetota bacterium]
VTYNMDTRLLAGKITPRTKAIVAQHTYGYPCEMDTIMDEANRRGLPVIEDCCLALGSTYRGRLCGTFGVAAYWSFQWNKSFTTGIGGMATTNDGELAAKIERICRELACEPKAKSSLMLTAQRLAYRMLIFPKTTAMVTRCFRWLTRKGLVVGSSNATEFVPNMAEDFFMRMGAGQARAGLRQLRRIDANLAHRRQMRRLYDQLLREAGWAGSPIPDYMDPVLVRYPVRVADKARAVEVAPGRRVELGTWFECPLHPIETPMHMYGYQAGMCPVAETAAREVVNLPMHPRANVRTAHRSMDVVRAVGLAAG